jgi:predicted MPP superfamily phosphohydrolase
VNIKRILYLVRYAVLFVVLILAIYGTLIEPYHVVVHHITIKDPYFGNILKDNIVVQLSDLHIDKIGRREKKVLSIINQLEPDIIFLTGDYVTWSGEYASAVDFLSRLRAKKGMWAVMGDYDYNSPKKSCIFCHEKGSAKRTQKHAVRFLKDKIELIQLPGGTLKLVGLDAEGGTPISVRERNKILHIRGPAIILSHSPLIFDSIQPDQDILVLAGDTHGGQIPIPVPDCILELAGYKKNARYNQGLFESGKKKMFVSRGIGTSHLPVRIFRQPEIVVYHFISEGEN